MVEIHVGKGIIDGFIRDWKMLRIADMIFDTSRPAEFFLHDSEHRFRLIDGQDFQAFTEQPPGNETTACTEVCGDSSRLDIGRSKSLVTHDLGEETLSHPIPFCSHFVEITFAVH